MRAASVRCVRAGHSCHVCSEPLEAVVRKTRLFQHAGMMHQGPGVGAGFASPVSRTAGRGRFLNCHTCRFDTSAVAAVAAHMPAAGVAAAGNAGDWSQAAVADTRGALVAGAAPAAVEAGVGSADDSTQAAAG